MKPDILLLSFAPTYQRTRGAFQIANHCRQHGYTCQVITYIQEFTHDELRALLDKFISSDTIIGISTFSFKSLPILHAISPVLQYIKTQFPNNKLVMGGADTHNYEAALKIHFDAHFNGYSEQAFVEYVDSLKGKRPKVLYPVKDNHIIIDGESSIGKFDIQTLESQWHEHDCLLPNEIVPIELSRGCIFKCSFCSYKLNGKKKFDYIRDFDRIKAEFIYNYEVYGITKYHFLDDTFNDSGYKMDAMHQLITSLPFKIEFWAFIRADLLEAHPEQITQLKEMGLKIAFFGIETLNQLAAKSIGKGLSTVKMKALLERLYTDDWKDMYVIFGLIMGLPHENESTIRETLDYVGKFTRWYRALNVLYLPDSESNTSLLSAKSEDYGYTFPEIRTKPDGLKNTWLNNEGIGVKNNWTNNMGFSEADAIKLLAEYDEKWQTYTALHCFDLYLMSRFLPNAFDLLGKTIAESEHILNDARASYFQQYKDKLFAIDTNAQV